MSSAGPGVRVGIGLVTVEVPPGSGRTPADEYSGTLRIAERAEQLGFDSLAWTCPAPCACSGCSRARFSPACTSR